MMTSDDKVGGWVKKGQNHDDVILECPLMQDWVLRLGMCCSNKHNGGHTFRKSHFDS